jgi:hypothetical protein
VLSFSYITGDIYYGNSVSLSNRTLVQDKWTFDLSLVFNTQHFDVGTDLTRFMPAARVSYRWRDRVTFETEFGIERINEAGVTDISNTNHHFFTIGYRLDF